MDPERRADDTTDEIGDDIEPGGMASRDETLMPFIGDPVETGSDTGEDDRGHLPRRGASIGCVSSLVRSRRSPDRPGQEPAQDGIRDGVYGLVGRPESRWWYLLTGNR